MNSENSYEIQNQIKKLYYQHTNFRFLDLVFFLPNKIYINALKKLASPNMKIHTNFFFTCRTLIVWVGNIHHFCSKKTQIHHFFQMQKTPNRTLRAFHHGELSDLGHV
ncbi:hypothetical protein CsatA_025917 [Cannabis sativa]